MKLDKNELSLVILGMEALMEQLKDNDLPHLCNLCEKESRIRYYECWDIANKARTKLNGYSEQSKN